MCTSLSLGLRSTECLYYSDCAKVVYTVRDYMAGGIIYVPVNWWVSLTRCRFVSVELASHSALVCAPAVAGYVARCFGTYVAEPKEVPGVNLLGLL